MLKHLLICILLLFISCESKDFYTLDTTDPYYLKLDKECHGSSCCKASLKVMVDNNYTLVPQDGICTKGFHREMMKCITTYQWCHRDKKK